MRTSITLSACFASALTLSSASAEQDDRRLPVPRQQPAPERRIALVVGNDAYAEVRLLNAANDARALGAALRDVEFNATIITNVGIRDFARAVDVFVESLRAGDVALFYYSGHGLQIDGENYLVPVDFAGADAEDAKYQAYSASRVHNRIVAKQVRLAILILDACRNNPFKGVRSTSGGWTGMQTGRSTYIAFATAPGETASDNAIGANGLFTTHLLNALHMPGWNLHEVFADVGRRVRAASNNKQDPWISESAGAGDQFVFRPGDASKADPPPTSRLQDADLARREELAFWESIKDSRNVQSFEEYVRQYPNGRFRVAAEARLAELHRPAGSSAANQSLGDQRVRSAQIAILRPSIRAVGNKVVTTIQLKNVGTVPILGLLIKEDWFNANNQRLVTAEYRFSQPLQPNEVASAELEATRDTRMATNRMSFVCSIGPLTPTVVPAFK